MKEKKTYEDFYNRKYCENYETMMKSIDISQLDISKNLTGIDTSDEVINNSISVK